MDNWKIQIIVVTFCALVQTYQGHFYGPEEERGLPKGCQHNFVEMGLTNPEGGLMKRAKALRFYGLMGKRSDIVPQDSTIRVKKPFKVNRRKKGEMFVGLMGRSISSGEALTRIIPAVTTTAIHVSEKPHKQGDCII
ncbi:uncharacterized protein KZ484_014430 [Pholidichthys leucotaenia]